MNHDKVRYLIVGTGRSGSSLLSAILADAGANFDMPNISDWNRDSGAYEHPKLISACKWLYRSGKVAPLSDNLKKFCETRIVRDLASLFKTAIFAKYPMAVGLTHFVPQSGYQPKVILSYRNFADYSTSMYLKDGINLTDLTKEYKEVNTTRGLQLRVFGGCAISYEELVNTQETSWANALGTITGLNVEQLVQSRNRRVSRVRKNNFDEQDILGNHQSQSIYNKLSKLKGKIMETAF